ncbi:MAG TPA: hypothetical protein VLI06_16020 [Solimonas sp.]|nr:hypothetical protein [Solimonas sp.]
MSFKPLIPALLALAAAMPVPAAWADPPGWAPAHGYRAKHRYVYYPTHEIYYEPASSLWFWLDGGGWRFGASLPVYYQQYTRGGISIELDADRPYHRHDYVVEHYGRRPRVEHHYHHDRPRKVIVEHHYDDRGHKHKHKNHKHHKHHD